MTITPFVRNYLTSSAKCELCQNISPQTDVANCERWKHNSDFPSDRKCECVAKSSLAASCEIGRIWGQIGPGPCAKASWRPRASFSRSMSPWRAMAGPFVQILPIHTYLPTYKFYLPLADQSNIKLKMNLYLKFWAKMMKKPISRLRINQI